MVLTRVARLMLDMLASNVASARKLVVADWGTEASSYPTVAVQRLRTTMSPVAIYPKFEVSVSA